MTTDSSVARKAMSREIRAPYTIRLKMSRPFVGSTPSRYLPLIPECQGPCSGRWRFGSIRSWWNSLGRDGRTRTVSADAKIAMRTSRSTRTPPDMATLSRRSRIQAI